MSQHKDVMLALVKKNAFADRTSVIRKAVEDASKSSPTQPQFGVEDFERLQKAFVGNALNTLDREHQTDYLRDGAIPPVVQQALREHAATLSKQRDGAS